MTKILNFITASIFLLGSGYSPKYCNGHTDTTNSKQEMEVTLKVLNETDINIEVKNTGKKRIRLYSHVQTYERQYDYFEVEAITPDHDKMVFNFYADREKSSPVVVELKPGKSFSHTINLFEWAQRNPNTNELKKAGLNHLTHGIKLRAKYRNAPCENCSKYTKSIWTGNIYSAWVDY